LIKKITTTENRIIFAVNQMLLPMAGIYIHIPFCASKCHYCNFFSTVSLKHKDDVKRAIISELEQRPGYLGGEAVETVYYGGGTPTLLAVDELLEIQRAVEENYSLVAGAEITIEANPDDLDSGTARRLRKSGFNRISIGTQAFDDDILSKLNRRHSAATAVAAVENAKNAGFERVSIDLIYGIPGLDDLKWKQEIRKSVDLGVSHISAYHLTVEKGTALDVLIRKKKYPAPDEDAGVRQFSLLTEELEKAGFEHYEISNFAAKGHYSRHNTNYWRQKPYLGAGPSAHSYDLVSRQWNPAGIKSYLDIVKSGEFDRYREVLTDADKFNEYVMLSLRTARGADLKTVRLQFPQFESFFIKQCNVQIAKGLMKENGGVYTLTSKGKFLADGIAGEFFV
jgi:oxygen-independent coproporphyrinogen-3 oxidase